MDANSNHCNLAFNKEIDLCRDKLSGTLVDSFGFSAEILLDRIMQRIVEIFIYSHALAFKNACNEVRTEALTHGLKIDCNQASLEVGIGKITFTVQQFVKCYADFLYGWIVCLFAILSFSKTRFPHQSSTLLFGIPLERLFNNGSDADFISYCQNGPIAPLRNGHCFLVETLSQYAALGHDNFYYSSRPHIKLIREVALGLQTRMRLLATHFFLFFKFFFAVIKMPILVLIGRDISYGNALGEIDRRGLIDSVVFTCSNFDSQPLWSRNLVNAKVHMIWYAQNWQPIAYVHDCCISDIPQLRWIRVDKHWVWTKSFSQYLKGILQTVSIEVVEPILFFLPRPKEVSREKQIIISVFDVSPFSDNVALQTGETKNYFNIKNLILFVEGVISLRDTLQDYFNLPVNLRLKTKRGFKSDYEKSFFDYLNELHASRKIELIDSNKNIFNLIDASDIVISYPFTSTNYVADFLRVPSVYFDPTATVLNQNFSDSPSLISFANSPKSLLDICMANLKKNIKTRRFLEE